MKLTTMKRRLAFLNNRLKAFAKMQFSRSQIFSVVEQILKLEQKIENMIKSQLQHPVPMPANGLHPEQQLSLFSPKISGKSVQEKNKGKMKQFDFSDLKYFRKDNLKKVFIFTKRSHGQEYMAIAFDSRKEAKKEAKHNYESVKVKSSDRYRHLIIAYVDPAWTLENASDNQPRLVSKKLLFERDNLEIDDYFNLSDSLIF